MVDKYRPDYVIAVGGGKSLDTGKLVAHRSGLPVVTIPTTGATCAAWTALSNVYSDAGAFLYDVPLSQPPRALILDYDLIRTAPPRTLVAGIGDALAKWYEASVSSGQSSQTLVIAAVQQARVLRDLLLQRSVEALEQAGGAVWQEVVDATVLLAGVIGGLGGAQCRTVAAHAIHNGLTHITEAHGTLHGEKVAYGILVQLRLEEMVGGNQLAATARHQLIKFYQSLGLPCELADLGLGKVSLADLQTAATIACRPGSDLHHLPFAVDESEVLAAMVSTLAPSGSAALKSSSPVSQSI
jgi:glycerol dehydrogenase